MITSVLSAHETQHIASACLSNSFTCLQTDQISVWYMSKCSLLYGTCLNVLCCKQQKLTGKISSDFFQGCRLFIDKVLGLYLLKCLLLLLLLLFVALGVGQNMRFQVCGLGKSLVTRVKWTDIRTITGVDSDMCPQIEIKRKSLSTAFKCALQQIRLNVNIADLEYLFYVVIFDFLLKKSDITTTVLGTCRIWSEKTP